MQKNSRNVLMPSSLPQKTETNPGCFKCKRSKCIICKLQFSENNKFESCRTKEVFTVKEKFTCDSNNIIYLISCKKCKNVQYVGQTEQRLRDRFYLHRSDIVLNRGTPLTCHFNENNHTIRDLQCSVIERVFGITKQHREDREDFWIEKLKTLVPYGLNVKEQNKIRKFPKKHFFKT